MQLRAGPAPCSTDHTPEFIIESVRCWCCARREKLAAQPRLVQVLAPYSCEMLSPVFDALFATFEGCLRRSIIDGRLEYVSVDERELLTLMDHPNSSMERFANSGIAAILHMALISARAMCETVLARKCSFELPLTGFGFRDAPSPA